MPKENNLKLNPKLFEKDIEMLPIRRGFGDGLLEAGKLDENVVGLCADLSESTQMYLFKERFPERFVQVGVAEQNLASVASGMAAMGKIPFISSYAMFSPGRNWEQIRTTICYNDVPVKIAGSHAGVSVGPDGGTHQAIEDIAITRVIPNMVVISPCDAIEARKATMAVATTKEPTYIRLAREKTPIMTSEETPFKIGQAQVFFDPKDFIKDFKKVDVGVIATGALLYKALKVAKKYADEGLGSIKVLNLSTIKPLDEASIIALAREAGALVTIEEHQVYGGMGSAIAECVARFFPVPIEFIGVCDRFGQSGTPDELLEYYGMGESDIGIAIEKVRTRKNIF